MSDIKSIQVQIGADTMELQKALRDVKSNFKDLGAELRTANRALKFDDKNIENYSNKISKLKDKQKEYAESLKLIEQAQNNVKNSDLSADEKAEKLRKLENEAKNTSISMAQLEKEIKKLESQKIQVQIEQSSLGRLSSKLQNVSEKAGGLASKFKYVSVAAAAGIGVALKTAFDFDEAFTDVTKTVDGTQQQLNGLKTEILNMSKTQPTSPETLSQIMALGGQFGIARENLTEFTKSVSLLEVATNLTAEEAATMIAQFSNVTGMPISNVEKFSSALVNLGNNTATTEKAIMEMSSRISGTASLYGFNEQEILGISAALSSVGISAEAGGTSISKTMTLMGQTVAEGGSKLESFAKSSGLNAQEFASAWKKEPIQAFEMFFKSLGKLQSEGKNLDSILKEMGINEVRMSESIKKMAKNPELLSQSLKVSADGWKENTALTKEAENKFASFQNSLKIIFNDIKATFLQTFEKISPVLKDVIQNIGNAVKSLMKFVGNLPTGVIKAFTLSLVGLAAVAPTFKLISVGAGLAAKTTMGLAKVIHSLKSGVDTLSGGAVSKFFLGFKGTGAITASITALALVIKHAYDEANKYKRAISEARVESEKRFELNDGEAKSSFDELISKITDFRSELRLSQADAASFSLKEAGSVVGENLDEMKQSYADYVQTRIKQESDLYANSKTLSDESKTQIIDNIKTQYQGADSRAESIFNKIAEVQKAAAARGGDMTAAEVKKVEGYYKELEALVQGIDLSPKSDGEKLIEKSSAGFKLNAEEQAQAFESLKQVYVDGYVEVNKALSEGKLDTGKASAEIQKLKDDVLTKLSAITGETKEEIAKLESEKQHLQGNTTKYQTEGQKMYSAFLKDMENNALQVKEMNEKETKIVSEMFKNLPDNITLSPLAKKLAAENQSLFEQIDFSQPIEKIKTQLMELYQSGNLSTGEMTILDKFAQEITNGKLKLSEIDFSAEKEHLKTQGQSVANSFQEGANTATISLGGMAGQITRGMAPFGPLGLQKGSELGRNTQLGIDSNRPNAVSLINSARATSGNFAALGNQKGSEMGQGTAAGINRSAGSAGSAASRMAALVKSNAKTNLHSNGVNIVQGFVSGLSSMLGSVASIASKIASTVDSAIRKKNEIKSPSRLMMRLGAYITEGLAIGLEKEIPKVSVAVAKMQKTITKPMAKESITRRIGLNQAALYREAMTKSLKNAKNKAEYDAIKAYWEPIIAESNKEMNRAVAVEKIETNYDNRIAKLKRQQEAKEKARDKTKNAKTKKNYRNQINRLVSEQKRLEQIKQIEVERVKSQQKTADLIEKMNEDLKQTVDKTKQLAFESMNKALKMILDNNVLEKTVNKLSDLNTYVSTAPIERTMNTIANTSNNTNNNIVINVQGGVNQEENKLAQAIVNVLNKKGVVV